MTERDARHRPTVVAKLEHGLATAKLLLRYGKNPTDRAKALKAIKELSAKLAIARANDAG